MGDALTKSRAQEVSPEAPAPVADAFLAMIERAAKDPAVDMDKMDRLYAMRSQEMARVAQLEFSAALRAAKKDMPSIKRNKYNDQTKSKYADLESVSSAMDPIITRHGFSTSFGTADSPLPNHYRITCTLSHDSGHEKDFFADIPVDSAGIKGTANKTMTHAFGSTMSYGRRYLKMMIFDVATTDDDGNAAGSEFINEDQVEELETLIAQAKANKDGFLKMCKIERLYDMPATMFAGAKDRLIAKRDAQK